MSSDALEKTPITKEDLEKVVSTLNDNIRKINLKIHKIKLFLFFILGFYLGSLLSVSLELICYFNKSFEYLLAGFTLGSFIVIASFIAEGFLFREKIDDLIENTESVGLYLFLFGGFIIGAVITLFLLMPIFIK